MKVLYIYPNQKSTELEYVINNDAPTDRFYGALELRGIGHKVDFNDERFEGCFGKLVVICRKYLGINIFNINTLLACRNYDVVVVKDNFCSLITLACKFWNVKIVYLDALIRFPCRSYRKLLHKLNFDYADGIVAYSKYQINIWSKAYNVPHEKFVHIPYSIDIKFYKKPKGEILKKISVEREYILSVGCDQGREFKTLIKAINKTKLQLKIISIPRLAKDLIVDQEKIKVYSKVPYSELLHLYRGAKFTVIILKSGVIYPSGIRALLEAMALKKAVIATRTPVLEEYFCDGENGIFIEVGDHETLSDKIKMLSEDSNLCKKLGDKGFELVKTRFNITTFGKRLSDYLQDLVEK